MTDIEYCEIDCAIVAMTDRAILIDNGEKRIWLPRSTIQDNANEIEIDSLNNITLRVAYWLAKKKYLI